MPQRASAISTNFTGGELSPRMDGRVDLTQYRNGCRVCENMIVLPWGPAARRGGLRFIAEAKNSVNRTALYGFEFSTVQTYALEVGDGYNRFYKDKAVIVVLATDAAITNGDFTADIAGWDDRSTGVGATISHDAAEGRLELNGVDAANAAWAEQDVTTTNTGQEHVVRFRVFGAPGDRIKFRIGSTSEGEEILETEELGIGSHTRAFTPTASPFFVQFGNEKGKTLAIDDVEILSGEPVELQTDYAQADLFDADGRKRIKKTQSADIMYLVHPDYHPRQLKRFGHSSWSLEWTDFIDGPYLDENADAAKTLQPSAATGFAITITAAGHKPFKATDIGRLLRIKHGTTWGWGVVVSFTSSTQVQIDVRGDFGGTTAEVAWQLGLWSETTGYPLAVDFHEERLFYGGAAIRPSRVDASKTNDFDDFTPGTEDADALSYNIGSNRVNAIRWFASERDLLVGTQGAEFRVFSDNLQTALTPTNVNVRKTGNVGAADMLPLPVPNAVLFAQRHGRKLYEMAYSFEADGYRTPEMTLLGEHVGRLKLIDLAYQAQPDTIAWAARGDGMPAGFTYLRLEQVTAWHRHPIGGGGIVESVAVIPGAAHDELWCMVRRTIGGATKRYVEVLEQPLGDEEPQEDGFYVDSGLTLDNTIDATLTPGAATGTGVTFTAGSSVFVAGDVDRKIYHRYQDGVDELGFPVFKTARAKITGFTSGTVVTCDILVDFPSLATIAAKAWRMTVTVISGADHLEGATVQILGDGAVQPTRVVTGGQFTLESPAATVHAGFGYVSNLKPMRPEVQTNEGTLQDKTRRVDQVTVRLHRSLGFKIGRDADHLEDIPFRSTSDPMDQAVPLFTGALRVPFRGDDDLEGLTLVRQDQPLPLMVVSLTSRIGFGEA